MPITAILENSLKGNDAGLVGRTIENITLTPIFDDVGTERAIGALRDVGMKFRLEDLQDVLDLIEGRKSSRRIIESFLRRRSC